MSGSNTISLVLGFLTITIYTCIQWHTTRNGIQWHTTRSSTCTKPYPFSKNPGIVTQLHPDISQSMYMYTKEDLFSRAPGKGTRVGYCYMTSQDVHAHGIA